ncbi:MAG TPA: RDD family protein [Actinomycetota bacterium]|nr:RDD family protein [Actinomycetota bacterium]
MTGEQTIGDYRSQFERWIGLPRHRRELGAELGAHLTEADAAGRLTGALQRLGPPREAARSMVSGLPLRPAHWGLRACGYVIDLLVSAAPTLLYSLWAHNIKGAVSSRFGCLDSWDCFRSDPWLVATVAFAAAWFVAGLTLMEWRLGRTPGKSILKLRVLSEDGTSISLGQAVVRRLPLVFSGGLQIIDWLMAVPGPNHQRGFDRIAKTLVVHERPLPRAVREPESAATAHAG